MRNIAAYFVLPAFAGLLYIATQPPAQSAPAAPRYEYKYLQFSVNEPNIATLNKLGADGWHVVAAYTKQYSDNVIIFERARR